MLSASLYKIKGFDVSKNPLVIKVMLGIFNSNPPKPRYNFFLNKNSVLPYLSAKISFKNISILAMILVLTSFFRVSDIAAIVF